MIMTKYVLRCVILYICLLLYFLLLFISVILIYICICFMLFFFFKQKTAYELRISDWSSDVCSSDLIRALQGTPEAKGETAHGSCCRRNRRWRYPACASRRRDAGSIRCRDPAGLPSHPRLRSTHHSSVRRRSRLRRSCRSWRKRSGLPGSFRGRSPERRDAPRPVP